MNKERLEKLKAIFEGYPEIALVYFFGSRAEDKAGPMSDYDFAIYLTTQDKIKAFSVKLALMDKIGRLFKTDKVDVVILNLTDSPELKHNIITQGRLIYEKEPYRMIVEPRILNDYFDFRSLLLRYHLTKA